jgi:MFS family permease
MIQFTVYSVITNVFSDEMMKYIGYCEIWVGVGMGLGPMLGSAVYPLLGYDGTMYFFGVMNLIVMLMCLFFIPSELNKTTSMDELAEIEVELEMLVIHGTPQKVEKVQTITWSTLLSNKHSAFALLICFVGTFNVTFYQSFICPELVKLGFSVSDSGYIMSANSITYLIACLIFPYLCEQSPRKLQFVLSILGSVVSLFMMGPS